MKRKKKSGDTDSGIDPNAWMGTLSDLVFLLITFFVLLISMSSLDAKRLKDTFGFFDDAVGVLKFAEEAPTDDRFMQVVSPLAGFVAPKDVQPPNLSGRKSLEAARDLIRGIARGVSGGDPVRTSLRTLKPLVETAGGAFTVQRKEEEIFFNLSHRLLFREGTTDLDDRGRAVLADMAVIFKVWGADVHVEAVWPWSRGPSVLAHVVEHLEGQWVKGDRLHPKLYAGWDRTIRFRLKKRTV